MFISQEETNSLASLINRVRLDSDLELESRWWNTKPGNELNQSDFSRLKNVLENNKSFKRKDEVTRKVMYEGGYFLLFHKRGDGKFKSKSGNLFKKVTRREDKIETQFGFRIFLSSELETDNLSPIQGKVPILFRERSRTSFVLGVYSFDLTVSRQSKNVKDLAEDDKLPEIFEVEIEYMGNNKENKGKQPNTTDIMDTFINNMKFVLSIIQDSSEIIGDNEKKEISDTYRTQFLHQNTKSGRMSLFNPLAKPIDIDHRTLHVIRKGYSVTEKADGLRMLAFIAPVTGIIYFLQHIGHQGLKIRKTRMTAPQIKGTVLDGEFIKENGLFMIIDILWIKSKDTRNLKLLERLGTIQSILPSLPKEVFRQKTFHFQGDIHTLAQKVLDTKFPYETDGLIFTPIDEKYDSKSNNIFKWKPPNMLTLDFLVIRNVNDPKEWKLYGQDRGRPVIFEDKRFPGAGIITVTNEMNKKFKDSSVIEFEWKGGKWVPVQSRPDKGQQGNSTVVIKAVFDLINRPVTKEHITGKTDGFYMPVETTIDTRNETATVGLRDFHNWVKEHMLKSVSIGSRDLTLVDFGSGKGGDIFKWKRVGTISSVEGFDIVPENVAAAKDRLKNRKDTVPTINFHVADLSKDMVQSIVRKDADIVTSFFGIHYFFDDQRSLNVFFQNVAQTLKLGGMFVVTTFDGKMVHDLLKNVKTGGKFKTGKFDITKKYRDDKSFSQLPIYGNKIIVDILDTEVRGFAEYLVKPKTLKDIALKHGLKLEKTGMFSELHEQWEKVLKGLPGNRQNKMSDDEKQLSFLNRYYIFQRVQGNSLVEQDKMVPTNLDRFFEREHQKYESRMDKYDNV